MQTSPARGVVPLWLALAIAIVASDSSAQTWTLMSRYRIGTRVRIAGDVDNDKVPDFLVGAPNIFRNSEVALVSGKTFKAMHRWTEPSLKVESLGDFLFMTDFNGDSVPDYLVGCPGADTNRGKVVGIDGKTRAVKWILAGATVGESFGNSMCVADVAPVIPDGKPELIVGSPRYATTRGRVSIFQFDSAFVPKLVKTLDGVGGRDFYGWEVGNAGNIDGTPGDDVIACAPSDGKGTGMFELVSGGLLTRKQAVPRLVYLGGGLLIADLDKDGQNEFVVAQWRPNGQGSIYFYEYDRTKKAFSVVHTIANRVWGYGRYMHLIPDLDNDTYTDFVILGEYKGSGVVDFYSGKTYQHLERLTPPAGSGPFSFDSIGDMDGDGIYDVLVGGQGGEPPPFRYIGLWSRRSPPALHTTDNYVYARKGTRVTLRIDMGASHAGRLYMVLGSMSGRSPGVKLGDPGPILPLNIDPYLLFIIGVLNTSPFVNFLGFLDSNGKASPQFVGAPSLAPYAPLCADYAAVIFTYPPTLGFAATTNAARLELRK